MPTTDTRVDAYIAKSAAFAKPILTRVREMVHEACPDVQETIKWGSPFFDYKGQMMCAIAAFKQHCALIFWKASLIDGLPPNGDKSRGSFGRITSIRELPGKKQFNGYIKAAMALNDAGVTVKRPKAGSKPEAKVPKELATALAKNKKATAVFAKFPPGQRREYCEWISEAKREETKAKRVAQAVEWIAEGKIRNWKY
ncbi:MAG: YdeI/OmpD-associated family protein [Gemmatimonadaceae bacterium]|nr:YdeI/OmpD-associated family protein [Gemmatimonadaceae bacterium]